MIITAEVKISSISERLIKEICKFPESTALKCEEADGFYDKPRTENRYLVMNNERHLIMSCTNIEDAYRFIGNKKNRYEIEKAESRHIFFMWFTASLEELTATDLMKLLRALQKVKK